MHSIYCALYFYYCSSFTSDHRALEVETSALLDVLCANVFSYSVGGFFTLLIVFFSVQKLFILMSYHAEK